MTNDQPIALRVRPRFWRAVRAPWMIWQFRKTGVSMRTAWMLTHYAVMYRSGSA